MNFRILCLTLLVALGGCSKPESNQKYESLEEPSLNSSDILTPEIAREFAQNLYKKMQEDEIFITDAFDLGEYETLDKYTNDFQIYAYTPYSINEAKQEIGQTYFPDGYVAAPYAICDRALNELNSLAFAMKNLIREDTAYYRKNLRYKQELYQESKAACQKRTNMSYEQAVKEYEQSNTI